MTPLQLQMMLWYYARPTPYAFNEPEHAKSVAVKQQRGQLVAWLLLEATLEADVYKVTDRGEVYVQALKATPLPVQKWVMP